MKENINELAVKYGTTNIQEIDKFIRLEKESYEKGWVEKFESTQAYEFGYKTALEDVRKVMPEEVEIKHDILYQMGKDDGHNLCRNKILQALTELEKQHANNTI